MPDRRRRRTNPELLEQYKDLHIVAGIMKK
jgi:hypothetical protein